MNYLLTFYRAEDLQAFRAICVPLQRLHDPLGPPPQTTPPNNPPRASKLPEEQTLLHSRMRQTGNRDPTCGDRVTQAWVKGSWLQCLVTIGIPALVPSGA